MIIILKAIALFSGVIACIVSGSEAANGRITSAHVFSLLGMVIILIASMI